MYFVLYDRKLKTIGETYIVESWSRTQRAVDYDDITVVGAEIPTSAEPFFVVVNDKQGHQMFSGLASSPTVDEKSKKTTLILKDYLTLFNSDIVINWDNFKGTTVADLIEFVFSVWKNQIDVGFKNIKIDVKALQDIPLDLEVYDFQGFENVQAYSLINNAISYYNLYSESNLDLATQTLLFTFKKSFEHLITIKLADFGLQGIEKSFGDINRVSIYNANYEKKEEWALTPNNTVYRLLPPGYKEVEFIQATGEQYIDTGFKPSGKGSKYIIDYLVPVDATALSLFGNSISPNYDIRAYHTTNNNLSFHVANTSRAFSFEVALNKRYELEVEAKDKVISAVLSDGQKETATYEGELNNSNNLFVFGSNNGERANGYKLYSFKAYDYGVLVRDFAPCIKIDTQEIGLFDKVGKKFYKNAGTGKFIAGKEVEKFIYPTKNKNYIAAEPNDNLTETQALIDAVYDAVMELAQNRYQEKIDLNALQYKSIVDLTALDFSYNIKVYMADGSFKVLPVGEIEKDSKGKHIIRLGYQIQALTQEL